MADLYRERKLQIPEDLAEILPEVDNRQAVVIEKKMYGTNSLRGLLDTSFTELIKPKKKNVSQFFQEYKDLFYDIPQEGNKNSHTQLIIDSTDYVKNFIDPRDAEIEQLEGEIDKLNEEIELLKIPTEHPFFKNGDILSSGGGGSYYIMDKGKKRKIVGGRPARVWKALKAALGYSEDMDDFKDNIVKNIPSEIVQNIKAGPAFDLEDLYGGGEEKTEDMIIRLTSTRDLRIDPRLFNNAMEWIIAVEKESEEEFALERNLEQKVNKYHTDKQHSETEEERLYASEQYKIAKEELESSRNRLVQLKKLYELVYTQLQPGVYTGGVDEQGNATIEGLSEVFDKAQENFGGLSEEELSSYRDEFRGWEKGNEGLGYWGELNSDTSIS
jgi:hypothetical protein